MCPDNNESSIQEPEAEEEIGQALFSRVVELLRHSPSASDSADDQNTIVSAMKELETFHASHPDSVPALRLLAECAQRLGRISLARKYLSGAETLDPWNLEILIISEYLYESDTSSPGKPGEPVRLRSALTSGVVNAEGLIEKAMGSFRLGDLERAYTLAKLAYRINPGSEHHLMDVLAVGSSFDPERTRKELVELEAEENPPTYLYLSLGSICNVLGQYEEAIFWLSKGIDAGPKDRYLLAMLYNEMAYVMAKEKIQLDQCVALARAALDLFPDKGANGFIRDTLGVAYLKNGVVDKAIRNLREAVSKDPTIIPRFHLALALLNDRDSVSALSELKTIASSRPSLESPHVEETAILNRVQSHIGRLEDLLNLGSASDIRDALEILDGLV